MFISVFWAILTLGVLDTNPGLLSELQSNLNLSQENILVHITHIQKNCLAISGRHNDVKKVFTDILGDIQTEMKFC